MDFVYGGPGDPEFQVYILTGRSGLTVLEFSERGMQTSEERNPLAPSPHFHILKYWKQFPGYVTL